MENKSDYSNVFQIDTWLNLWLEQSNSFDWNTVLDTAEKVNQDLIDIYELKIDKVFTIIENWFPLEIPATIWISTIEQLHSWLKLPDFALKIFLEENNLSTQVNKYKLVLLWTKNIDWELIISNENLWNKQ
jgi:hypothetical protein